MACRHKEQPSKTSRRTCTKKNSFDGKEGEEGYNLSLAVTAALTIKITHALADGWPGAPPRMPPEKLPV